MSGVRFQRTEDREQKADDRKQMVENRTQMAVTPVVVTLLRNYGSAGRAHGRDIKLDFLPFKKSAIPNPKSKIAT